MEDIFGICSQDFRNKLDAALIAYLVVVTIHHVPTTQLNWYNFIIQITFPGFSEDSFSVMEVRVTNVPPQYSVRSVPTPLSQIVSMNTRHHHQSLSFIMRTSGQRHEPHHQIVTPHTLAAVSRAYIPLGTKKDPYAAFPRNPVLRVVAYT